MQPRPTTKPGFYHVTTTVAELRERNASVVEEFKEKIKVEQKPVQMEWVAI